MADTPGDERTLRSPDETAEGHHVDVEEAEQIFNELSRALSRRSNEEPEKSRETEFNSSQSDHDKDLEKGAADGEERFDLREYLQSSNDAHQSAGIKHKHVGVTWEDLQVDVAGAEDTKVNEH